MKKIFKFFALLVLFACSCEQTAMATVFNCKTVESSVWDHGRFKDKGKTNQDHDFFKFDDETGTLWSAYDMHSPQLPLQMRVLQRKRSGANLVAISEIKEKDDALTVVMFQIHSQEEKNKPYKLTFFYFDDPLIFSGKCDAEKQSSNDSKKK